MLTCISVLIKGSFLKESKRYDGPVQQQVGFLIKRAQQALRARMDEALSEHNLTTSQFAVLSHLREIPSLTNAELARRSFVTAPTMLRIVRDLESIGFVEKSDNEVHGKAIDITITAKGAKALSRGDSLVQSVQEKMLDGLSKGEIGQLAKLLASCAERLEDRS